MTFYATRDILPVCNTAVQGSCAPAGLLDGNQSDDCYLQDLFVADDARGSGVGRVLIEHVYADARRRGASRVYWLTHEFNHNARQLYDRVADRSGFIHYRKLFA
jgi:GNAT superfamily N-acetyltransferase